MDSLAPLIISADPLLVADVQRLAAAAGVVPQVVEGVPAALAHWSTAPIVFVGHDLAADLAAAAPERRPAVHVLAPDPSPDAIFRDAVGLGAEDVLSPTTSGPWLVELLIDAGDGDRGAAVTVGVLAGSGGAGGSVFAAALAQVLARRGRTLLVDADPLGAGQDRILGMEERSGVRWDSLVQPSGRLSSRSLREALPCSGGLSVLAWPPGGRVHLEGLAMREALSAGRRGFEHVVIDLPRHLGDVAEETLSRCDRLVLVTMLTVPALGAAARLVNNLPEGGPACVLVTRGSSGGVAPEAAGRLLGLSLLAEMSDQRGLDESIDLGIGPVRSWRGPLGRAARRVSEWVLHTQSVGARGVA